MANKLFQPDLDRAVHSGCFGLDLFGDFALRAPDGALVRGLSRKARGLIAYLAITRECVSRDELATLLWGDREVEQARASLRQACYELRHALPVTTPLLLAVGRDEIALDRQQIVTDIASMAAVSDDPCGLAEALDPARRLLLRDLTTLSPAFDDWLRIERVRLSDVRRVLAIAAAREASESRRWADARQIATALLFNDPTDADAAKIAMRAAVECDDPEAARSLYARHAEALRRNLDTVPSAATRALLGEGITAVKAAPKAIAKGRTTIDAADLRLGGSLVPTTRHFALLQKSRRSLVVVGAVIAVAVIAGTQFRSAAPSPADELVRVEALAAPRGDEEAQAVSAGLRAAVARNLAGSETPVQIIDAGIPGSATPALIVRGNTMNDHGLLRANIEFVSTRSAEVVWAWKVTRPVAELDQFEDQIGLQIARELHFAYTSGRGPFFDRDPELARLSLAHTDTLARSGDESVRFAALITSRAPGFARGWAEYATDYILASEDLPTELRLAAIARARRYALLALALNPHEGLAYGALMLTMDTAPQWIEQDAMAARGMTADPKEPMIHSFRYDSLAGVGRLRDALVEAKLGFQREHFLPGPIIKQIEGEAMLGDRAAARDDLALAQRFWPHHPWFEGVTLQFEFALGDPVKALKLLDAREAKNREDRLPFRRAFLQWRIAPSATTKAEAIRQVEASPRGGGSVDRVQVLTMLGQIDAAYRLAANVPTSSFPESSWFAVALAPFRADPRFMTFAARMGLARIWQQTGRWPDFCSEQGLRYDCKAAARAALLLQDRVHASYRLGTDIR